MGLVAIMFAAALADGAAPSAPTEVRLKDFVGLEPARTRSDAPRPETPVAKLMSGFYPARAFEQGVEGRAVIECDVGAGRELSNCVAVEGSSATDEFQDAAVRLSAWLRFKEDATPPAGTRVRLPLLWLNRAPEPVWLQVPTQADLDEAYPEAARRQNSAGAATLKCLVTNEGGLTNCEAWLDEPPGLGFSAAALSLAPKYVVKGGKYRNKPVRFTISWGAP